MQTRSVLITRTRLTGGLVAALLLLGATACGSDSSDDAADQTSTSAAEPAATDDATTSDPTDDSAGSTGDTSSDGAGDNSATTTEPSSGGEAVGVLTVNGEEIDLSELQRGQKVCVYNPEDPEIRANMNLKGEGADGTTYTVRFNVSNIESTLTKLLVTSSDGTIAEVRWESNGELAQSNDDGSFEVADGVVSIQVTDDDGGPVELKVDCELR